MILHATDLPQTYNAAEILEHNLPRLADKTALFSLERHLTFQQVSKESNQVAHALKKLDVRFGETVAILCLDQPEWVTTFFGTLKVGAIGAGLNTLMTSADLDYILRDCRARVIVIHASLWGTLEPILVGQPFLKHIVLIKAGEEEKANGQCGTDNEQWLISGRVHKPLTSNIQHLISYENWIAGEPTTFATEETHREDYATLNYSSGTTGRPKGILHAHKDLPLISEYWGKQTLGLVESDRTFAGAKLFFTYGTGGNLLFPWYVGASVVLFSGSPRKATNLLEMVSKFKPTIFYNAPTGYAIALSIPQPHFEQEYDLSSIRLCVSGGENLPAPIWHQWHERTGIKILNGCGCTEVYHNFISNRPDDMLPGASGRAVEGFDLKIVDPNGNEAPIGKSGNLLVQGDTVALSYLHRYERSKQTFLGDWFSTGDRFRLDENGYYWHEGRVDDMLKVGGIWVSPMEVESALIKHPAVVECAIVGYKDADGLVKPKAFVTLNDGYEPSVELEKELISHCANALSGYKRPRIVEFVDELPKTATGKIQRFKLR